MAPKIRTESDKAKARTLILDAARELFVEKGVEAVTMREIAKNIGYSPTTIYLYFKDKESLLHALCVLDFEQFGAGLNEILKVEHPVARMHALGTAYAEFAMCYPNHYRLMFMTARIADCETVREEVGSEFDSYDLLNQVVNQVYDEGCFLAEYDNPALIAQTIWAAIHGVCALEITLGDQAHMQWQPFSSRAELMLLTLHKGLIKPEFQKEM